MTAGTGLDRFGDDRRIVAARVDGELRDLSAEIPDGASVEPVSIDSPDGLAVLRHSTAHVAAQAVQSLHPEAKLGIGPPITDGFYYDFDLAEAFTPDDLRAVEKATPAPATTRAPTTTPVPTAVQTVAGTIRGAGNTVVVGAQIVITPIAGPGGPATGVGRGTMTDEDGQYRISGVASGRIRVAVRRIGYQPLAFDTVSVATLDVTLEPVAQKLAAIVVRERRRNVYTGRLAGFNRRRDLGFGRFITAADIDNQHPMRTTDLLRMIPGVYVSATGPTNRLRIRNANCDPLVWIDGMPALAGYFDIDAFDPRSLAGIEVYSGVATVPVELRGTRGEEACGVVAVWSRLPEPAERTNGRKYTAADLARLVEAATVYTADQVDRPARLDSTVTLSVNYPDSLRNRHTPGQATVEFVVDTTGAVELGTIGVVAASNPSFGDAARQAATTARFVPAAREGRLVRQLVQLPLRWETAR